MPTRRKFLAAGIASCLSGGLSGCINLATLQPNCRIGWAPSILQPVFYGFKDYAEPAVRVYYPSLEGSPNGAPILSMCERFPLVLFIHGDCGGDPYAQWISLAAQLARSGYVVAVTQYGGMLATGDAAVTAPLRQVHAWMRSAWEFQDRLMPVPQTAVVGHSYGGTLGAQLVTEIPVKAFASLSGTFGQATDPRSLLSGIRVPSLFLWNNDAQPTNDVPLGAQLYDVSRPPTGQLWSSINLPKHGVIFESGHHGDYMSAASAPRCDQQGPCNLTRVLAADFVTAFLSKYLPPEYVFTASSWIPDSLIVRPQDLPSPPQQGFYAGSFLLGFSVSTQSRFPSPNACVENILWQTAASTGSTFLIPT